MASDHIIKEVADFITDDPDVINEAGMYGHPTGRGEYKAEEVPLAPNVLGEVVYNFDVISAGKYIRGDMINPPEYPEAHYGKGGVVPEIVSAYDLDADEFIKPRSPEELASWKQSAVRYFDEHLADKALDREQERFEFIDPRDDEW